MFNCTIDAVSETHVLTTESCVDNEINACLKKVHNKERHQIIDKECDVGKSTRVTLLKVCPITHITLKNTEESECTKKRQRNEINDGGQYRKPHDLPILH